jgi:hypothetical protein
VQFLWRPASSGGGQEGLIVTQAGDLFLAKLGMRPEKLTAACIPEWGVRAAAWSSDGSLLALATGAALTLMHLESGLSFSTELASQVTPPGTILSRASKESKLTAKFEPVSAAVQMFGLLVSA